MLGAVFTRQHVQCALRSVNNKEPRRTSGQHLAKSGEARARLWQSRWKQRGAHKKTQLGFPTGASKTSKKSRDPTSSRYNLCYSIPHNTTLHYTTLRYATLRYAALRCATLRCAALRCAALRCAALRCATLRCAGLRYAALRYAALRCAMLCYAMPCYPYNIIYYYYYYY